MHKAPLPTLFLVAILVAASARAADPPRRTAESVIEEITRLITVEWPQAIVRRDVQWFDHHLADELLQSANDELTTKTEAMASVRASLGGAGSTTEIEDLRVNAYGDVAVTAFQIHVSGTDNNRPLHRTVRYTETWVFRDGRWQLVASHSSVLPLPPCGPMEISPGR